MLLHEIINYYAKVVMFSESQTGILLDSRIQNQILGHMIWGRRWGSGQATLTCLFHMLMIHHVWVKPCTESRILFLFVKSVQLKNVVHFKGADVWDVLYCFPFEIQFFEIQFYTQMCSCNQNIWIFLINVYFLSPVNNKEIWEVC